MSGLERLLHGRVLGDRYRIEEVIGRGGMGAVYRALDERLGRRVAVKVITVAMGDDPDTRRRVRARFHREARSAAALPHHPNVVPVYDYGTDEELGLDYIVMELLKGQDLATRLQTAGAPPLAVALTILREACRGLAVGHRAGLVHRDIKPGNIFLAESDQDEMQVRVVDFGIAKLADDEDTLNQLTQDGRIPHSPAYASPEQLRGLSQLTPASDVYSLGAVGFQLLTGERPFSESDRNRMSLGMPVPPPPLRSRNPALPGGVEEVVQKALAYEAVDRFPDAAAMSLALERAAREIPDSPIEPYAPLVHADFPAGQRSPSVRAEEDDDERTQLLDVASDDDRTMLAPPVPVSRRPPASPTAGTPVPTAAPAPPRKRRTAAWVWSAVLLMLLAVGVWAWWESNRPTSFAGQPTPMDTIPVDSATEEEDSVAPPAPDAAEINLSGIAAWRDGRFSEALRLFERALELDPTNAELRQNRGVALYQLNRFEDAARDLAASVESNPALDVPHVYLAQIQLAREDTAGAIASLEKYLETTGDAAGRARAQAQLRELRIERSLLGDPVDTVTPPEPGPTGDPQ